MGDLRELTFKRADPNKLGRGAGYYYKRNDYRAKGAIGKQYWSRYSITRDFNHKPNSHDRYVVNDFVGGQRKYANLTDNPKKAGKYLNNKKIATIVNSDKTKKYSKDEKAKAVWKAGRETEKKYKEKLRKSKYAPKSVKRKYR